MRSITRPATAVDPLRHFGVPRTGELLDLHPDSVRNLIKRGLLPASNVAATGGKARWKIAAVDIAAFLAARRNVLLPEASPPLPEPAPKPELSPTPPRRRKRADGHKRKYFL